jgi:hypothetical protein
MNRSIVRSKLQARCLTNQRDFRHQPPTLKARLEKPLDLQRSVHYHRVHLRILPAKAPLFKLH